MANFTSFTSAPLSFVDNGVAAQALPIYGTSGTITNLSISLLGLTHTFPDDLDILLVAPNGKRNILFMSDAGGDPNIGSVDLTFSDAFSSALPNESQIVSGNYRPTDFEPVETDADFLTATGGINSGSATTFAAAFNSFAANGDWRLYVRDDVQSDVGSLASWGLTISTSSSQARVTGTSGADNLEISSDDGSSGYFVLSSGGGGMFFSDVASWDISGGAGPDTISFRSNFTNSYVFDLTNGNLTSIEVLQFLNPGTNGSATVRIGASEIGAGFATNGTILGNSDLNIADTLDIVMGSDTNVDLSTIIFNFFDGSRDKVTVTGDGSSETIIGTNLHDVIVGNGGNDHISSRGGDDFIEGGAGGDHIDGGTNGADGDTASYANSAAGVNVQ
ncbi:MAG: proprotein convertase P-domain-containing protein, partial [Rhodobiaceae bacterium]|nr:proprotein convertase P-domain-containing protein [Rhodobiaceae bacterium]